LTSRQSSDYRTGTGISDFRNGYIVLEPGYEPYYGPEVPIIPSNIKSKYGWKLDIDQNGRKFWSAMNESEIRNELGKFLGIDSSTMKVMDIEPYLCNCDPFACGTNRWCNAVAGPDSRWCSCSAGDDFPQ